MPGNFDLLLNELHAADRARSRGATLAKAADGDWVRGRRQRDAAAAPLRAHLAALDRMIGNMGAIAKALPAAVSASPRETFAKAFLALKEGKDDAILNILRGKDFVRADDAEYGNIRKIARDLKML